MKDEFRNKLTSICRDTAKSLDMTRSGSRWVCEVTEVNVGQSGVKNYRFYILDKNSGHEYEARAKVENNEPAEWDIREVNL